MKEVFKKLFGIEPMSKSEKDFICFLPCFVCFFFMVVFLAAVIG